MKQVFKDHLQAVHTGIGLVKVGKRQQPQVHTEWTWYMCAGQST